MTGEKSSRRFLRPWGAVCAVSFVMLAGQGATQAVKLSGEEITQLLLGNTAVGVWEGVSYRQYFAADGVTFFAQNGSRTARGAWRVDTETDEYQSIWPGDADWEGWFVMEWDGTFYWVSRATPPTPFDVIEGEALTAAPFVAPTCADLRGLTAQAAQNFLDASGGGVTFAATQPLPGAQQCRLARGMAGANIYRCAWAFDYRSVAALAAFEALGAQLETCGARAADASAGEDVNHPDTYIRRRVTLDDAVLSTALKDKAGPQQTFVSLTIEGQPVE